MNRFYRYASHSAAFMSLAAALGACNPSKPSPSQTVTSASSVPSGSVGATHAKQEANALLNTYLLELAKLEKAQALAYWTAANSGKKEDFDAAARAELELKKLHSSADRYRQIVSLLERKSELEPLTVRSLEIAELAFKGNQLPPELLEKMVNASSEIEKTFNTFRAQLEGKKYSNNELLDMLAKQKDSKKRQAIWEGLKQVGERVGPQIIALAKIRNEAATKLGYANYWDMQVRLQEHDPERLMTLFQELENLTNAPFAAMKTKLDEELAQKLHVRPEEMMPWHYDNPFFQDAPPSSNVDLDDFYQGKKKEDIVAIAKQFYSDIGIDITPVLDKSDLYERDGKDQHAFCIAIDREGDVRTLLNIKPKAEWMDTMLHEQGHAVYYRLLDHELPYNLREAAHIFTTEAIAMMFGALAKNPTWMTHYVGADKKKVKAAEADILEQRRREQLIFTRWTLVMLHFEKALYENPDQDLNQLWWDIVEKYQSLRRPPHRHAADWASKPHFTIAPVYYHNYMLGELFASQLRASLATFARHEGPTSTLSFNGRKEFGEFLTNKVFKPGMRMKWPQFVRAATGEELTAKYFAREVAR
ncbi:MAG TPA: M2 family metallopeptidase [Polyangiaceae bacterium]|nr:MAG: putative metalloprotease YpwA [Deltaproteobacteria bacterium ADurb.Bin207]HNS99693.1 M2 family metallopeptidase [Polyangiaceae bacterium]HNZ24460.1 M2 family metallopeptidase [Polyangiaceae bacterium]HOD25340.1 M2 family metallopeptidase [Polyangiaceae bacterium]HOE50132.1 M2 family metallopeptidase [Polyangiaceae bacterium]